MTAALGQASARLFVGRERELRDLLAGFDDACAGRGRVLLLVGEPGIGKTRTADELAGHARERDAHVLVARCHAGEGAPPYWPWVQLLRGLASAREPPALLADLGRGAADIAQVIDELRQRLPDLPAPPALEAEQTRFRFFDGVATFLKNAARRQPLVLILDDLHSADHASLLLLQFLAREIADARVLVVGTYRDAALGRDHPLLETIAELAREPVSRTVPLQGLSESDVARFVELVAGSAPPGSVVAAIHRRTEGNPFFVTEVVRLLAPDGIWGRAPQEIDAAMPLGVQEVIAARLAGLSMPCRELLEIAAVVGREFDTRVVAAVAGKPSRSRDGTPDGLLAPLEEALRHRIINEIPGALCTYGFTHALIRDALYVELSSTRRLRLHRRVGEALETVPPTAPDARLAELAYHFVEASAVIGDDGKAAAYARRAGEQAQASLAYEEAARCYELALRALRRQGANEREQCHVLLAMGAAHHQASDESAARATYGQGVDLARRLDEHELLARAALGFAGVVIGVEVDREVIAVLEEGLAGLQGEDSGLRAMLLARLAMELYFSPDADLRLAVSAEAVATARRAGDDLALIHALEARHFAVWSRTGPTDRLAITDEMIRLATAINNAELLMQGHHLSIAALLELGRIEDVDSVIATYARLADQLRQPSYQWGLTMCRALRATIDGRFEDAEALAATALALGQNVQPQTAANFYGAQIFFLRREQGRLAELEDALQGAAAAYPNVRGWRAGLACLYAETERPADAARELAYAAADGFRDVADDNNGLSTLSLLADACAFLGDRPRAAVLYERLLPHAELVVVAGIASACTGTVTRPLGLLAATLGRWEDAWNHFERALAVSRRLSAPPFIARVQVDYAASLLTAAAAGAGNVEESVRRARQLLGEAHVTARRLGMNGVATKADALMNAVEPAARSDMHATGPADNVFCIDGDHWIVAFEGQTCRFKDVKGLRYISLLLHDPNRSFHVTELLGSPASHDSRARLRELWSELEEAERYNDPGRAARVQTEIDELTHELTSRMGLEPRVDSGAAASQLLRLRITKAIKAAARKISTQHPALGHHLQTTIRTGSFCSYVPDPTKPIRWR